MFLACLLVAADLEVRLHKACQNPLNLIELCLDLLKTWREDLGASGAVVVEKLVEHVESCGVRIGYRLSAACQHPEFGR